MIDLRLYRPSPIVPAFGATSLKAGTGRCHGHKDTSLPFTALTGVKIVAGSFLPRAGANLSIPTEC
jgi:hypothetical protein